jgi:glycine cleavage system H protein
MDSKLNEYSSLSIIPKSQKKCVWMELGIVSYKMCDRNFECDNCPLDEGLRGDNTIMNHPKPEKLANSKLRQKSNTLKRDSSLERMLKMKLDGHYYVHPGHCWIKVLNPNLIKIGIDDIVATTLGNIDEVVLPLTGEKIRRNASCGQIIQFEHIFSVVSPVCGKVIETNKELANFPSKLTLDPLNQGWMISLEPDDLENDLKHCRSGDALYSWYLKEFKWLENNLNKGFQQELGTIGFTLNDGGEISRNLRNYLAKDHYRKLIIDLLGVPNSR